MRELNLDRLRTLVTIADLGSFAEAARVLHLAAPTVSLHMADLEAQVGAPLLLRKRGEVRATGVGEALVERARRLLADADDTLAMVQRQVQGLAGRVRLGASTGAIAHLLPQALEVLGQQHPDIDVQVAVLTSHDTMARLAGGTLDVGLVALPQPPVPGVQVEPWRRDPVMAFVPAQWPAPTRATPHWLAGQPLILNDEGTSLSRLTGEWFALAGEQPRARIELNYNDAIKSLVAAGYGATLLPHEAAVATLPDPRIRMLALRPALWRPLGLAHRAGAMEKATQHVLDVLWQQRQA
ncbi:LysR family transcriptional regulator [Acidovorax sp. Root217]|uniref:LysR family transcriptional regulator n=1 Tax=Acidovorax sp. Root217 TaxID=1736492 RepID=UPI0007106C39|nr:LysR family transcriptional regulator [Acidovorax sp. Root217]KRC23275.1 LysR family transcriptional regulator [Acidovorax sp. Root217]